MKIIKIFKRRFWRTALLILLCLLLLGTVWAFSVNAYVKHASRDAILTPEAAAELGGVDCILVLGCLVKADGTPSDMLSDRLQQGIELYEAGASPKLLMSGDHHQKEYDEVNAMKQYAVELGVPPSEIFMDHAGLSTYDSLYRAKSVFGAEKIIIVTQEYHLYRAVYLARALGIEAYGVASDRQSYAGQWRRDLREILARNKDFLYAVFQPAPAFGGDPIDLSGNGNQTNDKA